MIKSATVVKHFMYIYYTVPSLLYSTGPLSPHEKGFFKTFCSVKSGKKKDLTEDKESDHRKSLFFFSFCLCATKRIVKKKFYIKSGTHHSLIRSSRL